MSSITWLHLSDLHFRADKQRPWDEDIVLRKLLKDVRACISQNTLTPDLILVSGDIAYSGVPDEYTLAEKFFDKLLEATGLPKTRLFVVPGNHDVGRNKISVIAEQLPSTLATRESVNKLLGDSEARRTFMVRFGGYATFLKDYFADHLLFDDDHYFYVHHLDLTGRRLAVLGLNTAWLARGGAEDRHRLALGERQVRPALDAVKDADLQIALLHHPFEWLHDFDREYCEACLLRCDFVLHGHLHRTGLNWRQNPDDRAMVIAAGASYESRKSYNSYNLVRLDLEAGQGTVFLRAWSDRGEGFWTKDVMTYRNVDDGQYTFDLLPPLPGAKPAPPEDTDVVSPLTVVPTPDPASLKAAYLNRLVEQTRWLPLVGMTTTREEGGLQLSAVYTALFTRRPEIDERVEGAEGEDRRSVIEVLNRQSHLVLLGEPGSGKTTFVNFIAFCLAGEALGYKDANLTVLSAPLPAEQRDEKSRPQPWDHGSLLPVRIVLRDLVAQGLPDPDQQMSSDTLWAFITGELRSAALQEYGPHLKRELLEHGGLILLDGLDEIPNGRRREQVKQAIEDFAATFWNCRFLITSRTYQHSEWKLQGFTKAVLSSFTLQQIVHFIGSWYAHIGARRGLAPQYAQGQATQLITAIGRSERLTELAARPLLLTLMVSLHDWRLGKLPEKREKLCDDAVELLLHQWERSKVVRNADGQPLVQQPSLAEWLKVDHTVVRSRLNQLAFEAHRDQPRLVGTAEIPQERLVSVLMNLARNPDVNPARLVEYIRDRAGLLVPQGESIYTFPHRTFQEYLAACYLTDHGFPDDLADWLRAEPERWREITLLAGAKAARGTSSAVWSLAEALCYRDPPLACAEAKKAECWSALLAAQILRENERERLDQVCERNKPKLERIRQWMQAIVTQGLMPVMDRALAGEMLAIFGDDRDFDELVVVPAGPFLMGSSASDEMSYNRERPQQNVMLPMFKISKYPVTNIQYLRFVEETGREWLSEDKQRPEHANHPAVYISWHDARAYCDWLTKVWQVEGRIDAEETVRLPTEAEWEKAARATYGQRYPWGDEWNETFCNAGELGLRATCAVGMFPDGVSPYGCLDIVGQVWEWTASLWGTDPSEPKFRYPYDPTNGRENADAGDDMLRVIRGGSFVNERRHSRCAHRGRPSQPDWLGNNGFRVVVSAFS